MNFSRPFLTVTPTVDGDVLHALALADAWFTVARLADVIGRWSRDGVRRSLNRLADQGVVDTESAGPAVLYRLNRNHLAAHAIQLLAELRNEFVARLTEQITAWTIKPVYAAVFGSAVGTRMRSDSDVDVFLVRTEEEPSDAWLDQILRLQDAAGRMTGNDAQILELAEGELTRSSHREGSVVNDVIGAGITVWGDRDWLARRARAA